MEKTKILGVIETANSKLLELLKSLNCDQEKQASLVVEISDLLTGLALNVAGIKIQMSSIYGEIHEPSEYELEDMFRKEGE